MFKILRNSNWIILLSLLLLVGGIGGLAYGYTHETTKHIVVEDRWWSFERRIRYKETHCTTKIDSDGWIHSDCDTEYYTRCRNESIGREWPPMEPVMYCTAGGGDFIDDDIFYKIIYRISDSKDTGQAYISAAEWDDYAPGTRGKLTTNAFGSIKYFEPRG